MSDHLRRAYLADLPTLYGNPPGILTHDISDHLVPAYTAAPNRDTRQDTRYLTTHDPRHLYGNRPMRPDGRLNLKPREWSGTTYMMAPCPGPTDSHETKSLVLENAIESLRNGAGQWRNKIDCLINHFNQPLVLTSAELETKPFHHYDSDLYQFTFLHIANASYNIVPIPEPNDRAETIQRFRTEAKYVTAEMTIDPRTFFHAPGTDGTHRIPGANTKTILIRIPHENTADSTQIHVAFQNLNSLRDVKAMITTCQYVQASLQFGTYERGHFTQDIFDRWIEDTKQQTKFEIITRLIRPAFVGDGIIETPLNRLVKCKQIIANERGSNHAATVNEHYERFTAIVGQLSADEQPYPLNITETFFNSLSQHLQSKLLRRNYRHPTPDTNQKHLTALQALRDLAIEEEREMDSNIQILRSAISTNRGTANISGNRTTRTFIATTCDGTAGNDTNKEDAEGEYDPLVEQCHTLDCLMTTADPTNIANASVAHTFLSPAEQALRQASGTDRPVECWGCVNLPEFHRNRFHRFYDCPNRDNPDVRRNAALNMKKTRQQWETRKNLEKSVTEGANPYTRKREASTMLTRSEITNNWQQLGFDNPTTAKHIADAINLTATDLPARRRQHMVREWVQNNPGQHHTPSYQVTDTEPTNIREQCGYTFLSPAILATNNTNTTVAFQAQAHTRLPLEISPTLPHCNFPIGMTDQAGQLKVALDSCAGVNIGHLGFHKAMNDIFPEMVASFKTMADYGEDNVTIGGVEASTAGNLQLTHVIEYKTPYRYRGEACTLAFGLSEKAAATAIVSINFLRRTKALWSYDDSSPTIHLTIWNTTLKVQYEAPTRRPAPTPQMRFQRDTATVYATRTK